MDFIQAIILGILQGLTEFLPVSSSGHLVVFQKLLGIEVHSIEFDVAVHVGTVLSIITIYWRLVLQFLKEIFQGIAKKEFNCSMRLLLLLFIGSIPTAIIGLSLKDIFEQMFSSTFYVGIFFCCTGLILFMTGRFKEKGKSLEQLTLNVASEISVKQALIMGVAQGAAIAPGISRAGATIATGIFTGLNRNTAAMFSFLLSIPAILGAGLLQLKDITEFSSQSLLVFAVGFLVAYLSGLFGLWLVLKVINKGQLKAFSYYLWALGASVLLWL